MELYECLGKYREITLELIDKVNDEKYLQELVERRTSILKKIDNIICSKEDFEQIIESLNILELDNKLQTLLKEEKQKTKNQIDILRKTREARKNYIRTKENPILFSAKS